MARRSEIVQPEAKVLLGRMAPGADGHAVRRLEPLTLERVAFFPLSWPVVHPIDEASPLWRMTHVELVACEAEFPVLLSGLEETFSQTVHARTSYRAEDLRWNARFANVFNAPRPHGTLSSDVGRLHEVVESI